MQTQELFLQMSRRQPEVFAHAIMFGIKPECCTGEFTRIGTDPTSAAVFCQVVMTFESNCTMPVLDPALMLTLSEPEVVVSALPC